MAWGMLAMAGIQGGMSLSQSLINRNRENRRRDKRQSFFNDNLKGLLEDSYNIEEPDYQELREAELFSARDNFDSQLNQFTSRMNSVESGSGFDSSGFAQRTRTEGLESLNDNFAAQEYSVDKNIADIQNQMQSMIQRNKIQAKEMEYQYLYG